MRNGIPLNVKKRCVEMHRAGSTYREIYENYFKPQFDSPQSFDSFKRSLEKWRDTNFPGPVSLEGGTYEGFTAYGATVQVSAGGEIRQAWIRQKADPVDLDEFIAGVKAEVEPYQYTVSEVREGTEMLEIPLFDMHWGINYLDYYQPVLDKIISIIRENYWDRIVIPFGQDFFHNDSIVNATTTKGTPIEKVDMRRAVKEARVFMYALIEAAIQNGSKVTVAYTPGNHDQSVSWLFMQILLERYGSEIVDDSFVYRRCFSYGKTAVMVTHGDSKQATAKNLAGMFSISFPNEFANALVREVHSGHLHHEAEADIFGVMVRRLSSGTKTDDWSDKEDFIGSHKRFMLFRWTTEKLKAIYYV